MNPNLILRHLCLLVLSVYSACSVGHLSAAELFDKQNLAAWCIVPFDSVKRGPDARAAMVRGLGLTRVAYDWRAEHVPQPHERVRCLHLRHF